MNKRYLVQVFGTAQNDGTIRYRSTIVAETGKASIVRERQYQDQFEMIQIVNSILLPRNGDVKNVLDRVHSQEGWYKDLALSDSESELLGWIES